ncbi:enoyl ACP reductase FabMG family protein [Desulfurispira natronophila]|uniref:Enoyl-[acyl-carrier-protein] reductase (NADH) n=1 Tax=Desulfurispira natronophila TaxID=682562 RepID=A0A7W8DGA3_9BACT|nr:hypothetical protein [Desulfurispira natronophila]MBB5021018.1 enoyl-[acyl-carrier-protein] reductase (NADH) [Desulfurispira natronophila]
MPGKLQGKNILFYGLIREGGFADAIAREMTKQGARVLCLAAPELDDKGEQSLQDKKIEVIRTPIWYGLKDDEFPEDFRNLKKPTDILAYQPDVAACKTAFDQSNKKALSEATQVFAEVHKRTAGKLHGIIHIMAGGLPRTRGMMVLTKCMLGTDDPNKFISTEAFSESPVFQHIVSPNIDLVTAISYQHIFTAGAELLAANPGCPVVALGYQGEHVQNIDENWEFSSYPGYLVGYAKNLLQDMAKTQRQQGHHAVVVNLMGAETASTNAFSGIEYYIFNSLRQLQASGKFSLEMVLSECQDRLLPEFTPNDVVEKADEYLFSPAIQKTLDQPFPVHSTLEILQMTLQVEKQIVAMHKNRKSLVTTPVSNYVKGLMARCFWPEVVECQEPQTLLDTKRIIERS